MTRPTCLAPALAAAALAASACGPSTGVSGTIHVGPIEKGLEVFALACKVGANGACSQIDAFTPLGQTTGADVDFPYEFRLDDGQWVVGAFADKGSDGTITDDVTSLDNAPFTIDQTVKELQLVTLDVWLGRNAPGNGSIRGTVHKSAAKSAFEFQLFLLDGAVSNPDATVKRVVFSGAGTDVAFEFFNVPPGTYHLVGLSDLGDSDANNDILVVSPQNPILVNADGITDKADLWIDVQSPDLGSISGTVKLNSVVDGLRLQVGAYDADPAKDPDASLVAFTDVAVPAAGQASAFTVPSLPITTLYLVSQVSLGTGNDRKTSARVYRSPGSTDATPIRLTNADKNATGIALSLGIGRVSGSIQFNNPPATLKLGAVLASVPGGVDGPIVVDLVQVNSTVQEGGQCPPDVTRCWHADYELFGLEDGTFDMSFIPDTSGDGWIQDELDAGVTYLGTPSRITIASGSREGSDFTITRNP